MIFGWVICASDEHLVDNRHYVYPKEALALIAAKDQARKLDRPFSVFKLTQTHHVAKPVVDVVETP